MIMVIVCEFTVPGGPWTTRFRPARTVSMTIVCDESASTTWIRSAGAKSLSRAASAGMTAGSSLNPSARRPRSNGCWRIICCPRPQDRDLGSSAISRTNRTLVRLRPERLTNAACLGWRRGPSQSSEKVAIPRRQEDQEYDAKICAQTLLYCFVFVNVFVAHTKVKRGVARVADQRNRNQDQRRLANDFRFIVLVPTQESYSQK